MTRLRVLVLSTYPALDPRHGGQLRLASLVTAYRERGFEVRQASFFPANGFYMAGARGPGDFPIAPERLQAWQGLRAPLIEDLASGDVVAGDPALMQRLERFAGEVDLVDLEHPWLLPVVERLQERGAVGRFRLVYGSHNIEQPLKASIFRQYGVAAELAQPLLAAIDDLERRSAARAVLVGAVTLEDAEQLRSWTRAPVVVAPNGIAPWRSDPSDRARWSRRLGGQPFALYVASAHPPNVSGLCESFGECLAALSPAYKLVIAGSVGEPVRRSAWYQRWGPLNERRAVFTGLISDADLSALRDLAHAFVLPMTSGGGSNLKTAEALYSGRHVVATPTALRGFEHLADLPGVCVVAPGAGFGKAVCRALGEPVPQCDPDSDVRRESLTWSRSLHTLCDAIQGLAA